MEIASSRILIEALGIGAVIVSPSQCQVNTSLTSDLAVMTSRI